LVVGAGRKSPPVEGGPLSKRKRKEKAMGNLPLGIFFISLGVVHLLCWVNSL
jgi:hypothetical protein